MAVTAKGFDKFFNGLARGRFAFQTDTFKIALSNDTDLATASPGKTYEVLADVTEIASTDNGYTAGGYTTTAAVSISGAVTTIGGTGTDATWTQSGANNIGPFQYAILYKVATVDSVTNPIVAMLDFGAPVTLTSGATFTADAGADGWCKITNPNW
jgi:hypothetical protein